MVRSGRVSRMKGFLANAFNLKPIVSVDAGGRGTTAGKSFSRRGNMKKILRMITRNAAKKKVHAYAIVHARDPERAAVYAEKLAAVLGRPPVYTMSASPVIGVHVGTGLVAIALTYE